MPLPDAAALATGGLIAALVTRLKIPMSVLRWLVRPKPDAQAEPEQTLTHTPSAMSLRLRAWVYLVFVAVTL